MAMLRVMADVDEGLVGGPGIHKTKKYFPELTIQDKWAKETVMFYRRRATFFALVVRVYQAKSQLVHKGYLYIEDKGEGLPRHLRRWCITAQGQTYLDEHWPNWEPRYDEGQRIPHSRIP